jgi:hypothetical protein
MTLHHRLPSPPSPTPSCHPAILSSPSPQTGCTGFTGCPLATVSLPHLPPPHPVLLPSCPLLPRRQDAQDLQDDPSPASPFPIFSHPILSSCHPVFSFPADRMSRIYRMSPRHRLHSPSSHTPSCPPDILSSSPRTASQSAADTRLGRYVLVLRLTSSRPPPKFNKSPTSIPVAVR